MTEKTIHQGRNIKRFREMFGIKQEALALELGDDWNQKKISLLEAKETVDRNLLEQIATVLKLPTEVFENYTDETALNVISNTFNSHDTSTSVAYQPTTNINTAEEWLKALEENKKLYERLLQTEKEKVALLERMLEKR